jgi:hypothetical protein
MRTLLCFCIFILALAFSVLRTLASDTATTSVARHLSVIAWLSGTFACTSRVTYSNGKTEIYKWTAVTSEPENGWLRFSVQGAPGVDYYGYDPKKEKYVMLGFGGPGDYAAEYFTVGQDRSIHLAFNNEFSNTSSYAGETWKMAPTANGYADAVAGPTHIHPGLRFQETGVCVRR